MLLMADLPLAIVEHSSDDGSKHLVREDSEMDSDKEDLNKALELPRYWGLKHYIRAS